MSRELEKSPRTRQREIFLGALDIAVPAERAKYLNAACSEDPELRQKVEERADDPRIILTEPGIGYRIAEN